MDFGLKRAKNPKESQEALMREINSTFWMELNITIKILAFYILSFQNSWYFTFLHFMGTKHPLNQLVETTNQVVNRACFTFIFTSNKIK